jgi:uncharacterized OsmC-like protein
VNEFIWTVRVRADNEQTTTVHARNLAFPVGDPVSFRPTDTHPSALELLLGALAADLIGTFRSAARRRRLPLDSLEMSLNGTLHDPLGHIGVVGEEGDPSVKEIYGALYVSSDAASEALQEVWLETLRRSPLYLTLSRAADLRIRLQITI